MRPPASRNGSGVAAAAIVTPAKTGAHGLGERAHAGREARGRRALLGRDERHGVGLPRGHVHLRQQVAREQHARALAKVGMKGTASSSTFDGRCVKTMVLSRPKRSATRVATRNERAESRLVPKKSAPERLRPGAEAQVEPVGEEALDDEAAGERVESLQAGELQHDAARAAQAEGARGGPRAGPRAAAGRAASRT